MSSDDHPPILDRAGAPMIWVASLKTDAPTPGAYIHFLPVTKLHFECFLCAQPQSRFDERWYDAILRIHGDRSGREGRVPPARIQSNNYWKAFLTGVRPDEARLYADWNGREQDDNGPKQDVEWVYELPTKQQWLDAYAELQQPTAKVPGFDDLLLSERTEDLLGRMAEAVRSLKLLDPKQLQLPATQMLMRFGVMEWVRCSDPREPLWGGFGWPHQDFKAGPDRTREGKPLPIPKAEVERYEQFGFRLIRRLRTKPVAR
jgi:hypothetical protein